MQAAQSIQSVKLAFLTSWVRILLRIPYVALAQLVEYLIRRDLVVGSIPTGDTHCVQLFQVGEMRP